MIGSFIVKGRLARVITIVVILFLVSTMFVRECRMNRAFWVEFKKGLFEG